MKPTLFGSDTKKLPAGQDDGGKWDGAATRALLPNVYVLKHVLRLVTGTPEIAQLALPCPEFHTGYLPVVTRLLVKTNPYISGFVTRFPRVIMPPSVSAN